MNPVRVFAALPDAALGLTFLITWFAPTLLGDHLLRYAVLSMLLEFIVIHSSALMGGIALGRSSRSQKILTITGLGLLYSVFLLAFGLALGEWWPTWTFWGLTANRMAPLILGAALDDKAQQEMGTGWAVSGVFYIGWVIGTTILPVPRFGISAAVAAAAGISGSGVWVEEPHRVIVAGAGYFLSQAYFELRRTENK